MHSDVTAHRINPLNFSKISLWNGYYTSVINYLKLPSLGCCFRFSIQSFPRRSSQTRSGTEIESERTGGMPSCGNGSGGKVSNARKNRTKISDGIERSNKT